MYCECQCHTNKPAIKCDKCLCVACPACGTAVLPWAKFLHRQRCESYRVRDAATPAIELLIEWMTDGYVWSWTTAHGDRDNADRMLGKMAELGMIGHARHPLGGNVWIINGKLFGRTDGIMLSENGVIVEKQIA